MVALTSRHAAYIAGLLVVVAPVTASAQAHQLRLPTLMASAAAAGDWFSTHYALRNYHVREVNPFLAPWRDSPGKLVSAGAVFDAAGISAWNLTMGRRHPRVAVAGLWAMTAFRAYLAIHNVRTTQKAERRRQSAVVNTSSSSTSPKY